MLITSQLLVLAAAAVTRTTVARCDWLWLYHVTSVRAGVNASPCWAACGAVSFAAADHGKACWSLDRKQPERDNLLASTVHGHTSHFTRQTRRNGLLTQSEAILHLYFNAR
ncbi:hypothetical protein WMY93_019879 [Mugilogobius chulae]|uniref:Secreted protein n=1 Tax=Mugilogobius chulae TaxID=88201 RepID=A0AAW0NFQ2_9GOBI